MDYKVISRRGRRDLVLCREDLDERCYYCSSLGVVKLPNQISKEVEA